MTIPQQKRYERHKKMHEKWAYTSQFHRVLHHFIFEKLESGPDSDLGSFERYQSGLPV